MLRGARRAIRLSWLLPALLLLSPPLTAESRDPAIALIIDDLGNSLEQGEAILSLPGPVTFAFLPFTPHAVPLALRAHRAGNEVMLHLPMDAASDQRLGPGALDLHMTEQRFKQTLQQDLAALPHVAGLNNHMGSLLTRHPGAMAWVMQTVRDHPSLFFVDSRTTTETVAQQVAEQYRVPTTRRDIFLDNERDPAAIRAQFERLLAKAQRQGSAVGIGHPYPETVQVLQELLPTLAERGVRLVTTSQLIQLQQRSVPWPEPSSPLPKVAKNSKR